MCCQVCFGLCSRSLLSYLVAYFQPLRGSAAAAGPCGACLRSRRLRARLFSRAPSARATQAPSWGAACSFLGNSLFLIRLGRGQRRPRRRGSIGPPCQGSAAGGQRNLALMLGVVIACATPPETGRSADGALCQDFPGGQVGGAGRQAGVDGFEDRTLAARSLELNSAGGNSHGAAALQFWLLSHGPATWLSRLGLGKPGGTKLALTAPSSTLPSRGSDGCWGVRWPAQTAAESGGRALMGCAELLTSKLQGPGRGPGGGRTAPKNGLERIGGPVRLTRMLRDPGVLLDG